MTPFEMTQSERVGGTRTLKAYVRVVAATNRDLEHAVAACEFRQDLYYRLKVVALRLPPLRERPENLRPLAAHFLSRFAHEAGRRPPRLDEVVVERFEQYAWPGNVCELGNVLERALVLGSEDALTIDDLLEELQAPNATPTAPLASGGGYHDAVAAAKRSILREALRAESGHQTRAAKRLGLTSRTLRD
jgi:DNA-binding NtrC family response regulator